MKNILQPFASLTLIAAVCAATLAAVNSVTKGAIAEIKVKAARDAARRVMPDGVEEVDAVKDAEGGSDSFVGRGKDGKPAGYAVVGRDAHGYGGDVVLMVGFTPDLEISGYVKLEASETPGLGSKLVSPGFSGQFRGMSARSELRVKKDGGEVEAITSATITSRAVCGAVNNAASRLKALLERK